MMETTHHIFERSLVSGTVSITIDKERIWVQHFEQEIKVSVSFDPPADRENNLLLEKRLVNSLFHPSDDNDQETETLISDFDIKPPPQVAGTLPISELSSMPLKSYSSEPEDSGEVDDEVALSGQPEISKKRKRSELELDGEGCEEHGEVEEPSPKRNLRSKRSSLDHAQNTQKLKNTEVKGKKSSGGKSGLSAQLRSSRQANSLGMAPATVQTTSLVSKTISKRKTSKARSTNMGLRHIRKNVTCEYCSKQFNCQQEFFDHRKKKGPSFQCDLCSKVVPHRAFLMVHMKVKHGKSMLEESSKADKQSDQCVKSEVSESAVVVSGKSTSTAGTGKPFKCELCGHVFTNIDNLKYHMLTHTKEMGYRCCVCPNEMATVTALLTHMAAMHSKTVVSQAQAEGHGTADLTAGQHKDDGQSDKFKCPVCDARFSTKQNMDLHCKTCNINLNTLENRDKVQSKKSEVSKCKVKKRQALKDVRCQYCSKQFQNQQEFFDHRKKKGSSFQCEYCRKVVPHKAFLMAHMKVKHGKSMLEESSKADKQSDQCVKSEVSESAIDDSGKSTAIETIGQPFKCELCGHVLTNFDNLKYHMLTHTKEMGYKCCVCPNEMATVTALLTHMAAMHSKTGASQEQGEGQGTGGMTTDLHYKPCKEGNNVNTVENCDSIQSKASKVSKLKVKKRRVLRDVRCQYCSKQFQSQYEFFDHKKKKGLDSECRYCHKNFLCKAYLLAHVKLQHGKNMLEEFAQFHELADLSVPIAEVPVGGQADVEESSGSQAGAHGHNVKGIKCDICARFYADVTILKNHVLTHTKELIYKCCVCAHETAKISTLRKHLATHSRSGLIFCKVCNMGFSSRSELSDHKQSHMVSCSLCGDQFANRTLRTYHYETYHKDDILSCHICTKMFSSQAELKQHVRYHSVTRKRQCPRCGMLVLRLNQHMKLHDEKSGGEETLSCDQCPERFVGKQLLQRHLRTHTKEKRYSCMECHKPFATCGGLRRHMRIHSNDRPFVCDICGKACSQIGNLRIHMQIHKKGTSTFLCRTCGQSFATKSLLQDHVQKAHRVVVDIIAPSLAMPQTSSSQMFSSL